ncbi:MAG: PAS domain S-box protein [Cyanobacteria bacterium Co-bin13]|nr:PAS domain S-box protein [Cyanobacteria bacterium Co-bin13]
MLLVWGRDRILFYNDAYASILGSSRDATLGEPIRRNTQAAWGNLCSTVEQVFSTGQALQQEAQPLPPDPSQAAAAIYTWSYSPLWDESGQVSGMFATGTRVSSQDAVEGSFSPMDGTNACQHIEEECEQANAALREREADFQAMFNLTSVGMAQANPANRRFLRVNAAFCALTGYTEAELLNLTIDDINHPDDRDCDRERFNSMVQGKTTSYRSEKRYRRKDGSIVWALATGNIIRDSSGQPLRTVALIQDITERKQDEEALRTNESRLAAQKAVLEQAVSGASIDVVLNQIVCAAQEQAGAGARTALFMVDADGAHLRFEATAGMSEAYTRAVNGFEISPNAPFCGTAAYTGTPVIVRDVATNPLWAPYLSLAQEHGIRACWSFPIRSFNGKVLGTLAVYHSSPREPEPRDLVSVDLLAQTAALVIEQHNTRDSLYQSEAKYRTLFESIDQGFCICEMLFDGQGKPVDYRFLEVNPVFEALTGLNGAVGKTARELVPTLEEVWVETYGRVVRTGSPIRFEQQSVAMNRWFDVNAFSIGAPQSSQFAVLFTDVSDRKKIEQGRERFLTVGSDLQVITSSNGYFQWVSPTFEQALGWSVGEMTSRPWTDFVHPDDISASVAEADSLFSGDQIFTFENRYRHKDGSYRWLLWKSQPYPEEQLLYAAAVDITERKQTQQQIQRTLGTLETLVASSPLPIVVIEPSGLVQLWNPAAEKVFGWSKAEVLGQPLPIVPPEKREECRQVREAVVRGEIFSGIETYRCRQDGSKIIVSISAALLEGNSTILLLFQDVTQRQEAETALRLNETQLQTLFDEAPLGIYMIDGDFRIRQVNPTALPVFRNVPDLIGRDFDQVVRILWPPALADEVIARFRHTLATGEPYHVPELIEKRYDLGVTEYYEWQINRIPLPEGRYGVVCYFRDISTQVLAREAIAQSEKRFRSFVEANVVGILFGDVYGGVHEANDKLLSIIGYTREELQAGTVRWTDITPAEYLPLDEHHVAEAKARGACNPYEKEYIRKDGSRVPVLVGYSLVGEEREESVAFILDLSDRKQAEAALRQSEARFRLMVESAKEYAILTLDRNGLITGWNFGAERLLGYEEAEILGRNGRILYTPEDNQKNRAEWEMQVALREGQAVNECWHLRKGGTCFWGSGLVMPLHDEANTVQGFVKILQDKTEQRQADQRFRLLYDTTSDLLATEQPMTLMHNLFSKLSSQLDLHHYYNYMVEEKDNRPMLHLRNFEGLSDEAAQALEWIELGQYLCGWVAQERQQVVLDQAQIASYPSAQLICSAGVTAYAGQPLIVQGRLLGTLSFASRTRSHFTPEEAALLQSTCDQMAIALERANLISSIQQQAEQLRQANQIKDEFLAVLSHELRSPLNPILGWTRLLQSGKLDAARQREALATIERNTHLQSQLIEDLLDISRIMQGKLTLNAAPVSLSFVISSAVETVRLAAEAKNIQILLDLGPDIASVSGDAARLQQVVWNLLSNAVKFTPNGGQITVELGQLDQLAQIRVIDTGKGIKPQFLPHVFEYFRQEDSSTTRKFGGLGLGLAIVRQIVEMHGGTVKAESLGENQGATFIVQLPVIQQTTSAPAAPAPTSVDTDVPLSNLQILVVDDDTDTREFQAFLLAHNGARVTAVASGSEALQVLDRCVPDVLVSDVGMAEMDGYSLIQQIRSRPADRGGRLPAIALTAYAAEADQRKALEAGFQAHITKPVEPEALVGAILQLLGNIASA